MSVSDDNKAVVRRFYEEIDKGNLAAMDELVAEDYINHDPPPFPNLPLGRAGLKRAFELFWKATPGHHVIEDQIASGDKVVMSVKAPGVPGGYEVLALVVWPGSVDVEAGHAELGFHRCHR